MALNYFLQSGDTPSGADFNALHRAAGYPHVIEGFDLSDDGGRTLGISSGEAFLGGGILTSSSSESVTVPDNTTSYVGIALERSEGEVNLPSGSSGIFRVETFDESAFHDYLPLATVGASGGNIRGVADMRWRSPSTFVTAWKRNEERRIGGSPNFDFDLMVPLRAERTYQIEFSFPFTGHLVRGHFNPIPGANFYFSGVGMDENDLDEMRVSAADRDDDWDISSSHASLHVDGIVEMGDRGRRLVWRWRGQDNTECRAQPGGWLRATDVTGHID